jgi:hypothetical protein
MPTATHCGIRQYCQLLRSGERFAAIAILTALLVPSNAYSQSGARDDQLPCEAYSQSEAVFVGVAGEPGPVFVSRDGGRTLIEWMAVPMRVERTYLGTTSPVMYVTPLGIDKYLTPNVEYLVYGRPLSGPVVEASPGVGAKELSRAAIDLGYLDFLAAQPAGAVITGVVARMDVDPKSPTFGSRLPMDETWVRIEGAKRPIEVLTENGGQFVANVPPGNYRFSLPNLPPDLSVIDPWQVAVRDRGCATITIKVVWNGRIRGVLRREDGRPLWFHPVDAVPVKGPAGALYSVTTNKEGVFEFTGLRPGPYLIGYPLSDVGEIVNPQYAKTYYPGTPVQENAVPIVVAPDSIQDGFDFVLRRLH